MRGQPLLNLKMWPATKMISIHTYIIERNMYIGGMGGSTTHSPFPFPSPSLCVCFQGLCRWWWAVDGRQWKRMVTILENEHLGSFSSVVEWRKTPHRNTLIPFWAEFEPLSNPSIRGTGTGFCGVQNSQPIPIPQRNLRHLPAGFLYPCHSLAPSATSFLTMISAFSHTWQFRLTQFLPFWWKCWNLLVLLTFHL